VMVFYYPAYYLLPHSRSSPFLVVISKFVPYVKIRVSHAKSMLSAHGTSNFMAKAQVRFLVFFRGILVYGGRRYCWLVN